MRLTGFIIAMHKKIRRLPSGKQRKKYIQFVEKVCFFQKVLVLNLYPQTPFPSERLCMLGWLCIVQSPCAYTPGVRAGAECGAAALIPLGATPQTPVLVLCRFIDSLVIYYR